MWSELYEGESYLFTTNLIQIQNPLTNFVI